jgi:hypothetical protein
MINYQNKTSREPGQPELRQSYLIPEPVKPWLQVAVAQLRRRNVTGPLRQMSEEQLRHIATTIGLNAISLPRLLQSWQLPQLEEPGFWLGTVAPAIKSELERRCRPKRVWGANSPIDRLKSLDIVDMAGRFTELVGHGIRLKGRCPLHQERTPSFYVYTDTQRWRCYGACADGGDIVDLLRRLGDQGKLQ